MRTNALNELQEDPEIITSKADKGGVVVGYQGLCTGRRNILVDPVTVRT